jgi:hypothetical protein
MSIFIVDLSIFHGPVEDLWNVDFFEDLLRFVCIVEHGEETEVITLFEVVAV